MGLVEEMRETLGQPKPLYVVLVLDRSGSMHAIRQQAVNLFNEQLHILRRRANTHVALVSFASEVRVDRMLQPVSETPELTWDAYMPDGMTAMYDGIDMGITQLRYHVGLERERIEGNFLVIVVTDGLENYSQIRGSVLSSRIRELQATDRWTFTVLGANVDLGSLSSELSIPKGNVLRYVASTAGTEEATFTLCSALNNYLDKNEGPTNAFFSNE